MSYKFILKFFFNLNNHEFIFDQKMQKLCCNSENCELIHFECIFENLSKFECKCKFKLTHSRSIVNDTIKYDGTQFSEWHGNNGRIAKEMTGSSENQLVKFRNLT